MAEPQVVNVRLQDIVHSLYSAADMGDSKKSEVVNGAFLESPHGIDIAGLGQHLIGEYEASPSEHSYMNKFDVEKMKKGIDYLTSGVVKIITRNFGTEPPIEGEYAVKVYDPKDQ